MNFYIVLLLYIDYAISIMEVNKLSILSKQKIKMIKTIECFKLKQSDSYLSDQIVKVKYLINVLY